MVNYVKVVINYAQPDIEIFAGGRFPEARLFAQVYDVEDGQIYTIQDYYKHRLDIDPHITNIAPANVEYYLDEESLFFVDYVENTIVNVEPRTPYKAGHTFIGWYKDLEYTEQWDFESDVIPENIYNDDNQLVNITKIYAQWEKI